METINKSIEIIGGGTFFHVRNHLAIGAPAYGFTARKLAKLCKDKFSQMDIHLHLTKMACAGESEIETNEDVEKLVKRWVEDLNVKIVFFNVAMCDFHGEIYSDDGIFKRSGKYAERLKTSEGDKKMILYPAEKIIKQIRQTRKDITLIGFKTTCHASIQEQYIAGLNMLKASSCNLVLANDTGTKVNMIITPEEAKYHVTYNRTDALNELIDIVFHRSQLTFTHSTVVDGQPISWDSDLIPASLRTVVNYCIEHNAYKEFRGVTAGHFACKIAENTFLTSIRKTNFNEIGKLGLVKVITDGDDNVIAYGAKPSVGGQSQRIIFKDNSEYDCVVHFHCPLKNNSLDIPIVSQREFECGSHQCGENTSAGLKKFGNLSVVMLDQHGPNIVFHHSIDPQEVIDFIEQNFDLSKKTGGEVELHHEQTEQNITH